MEYNEFIKAFVCLRHLTSSLMPLEAGKVGELEFAIGVPISVDIMYQYMYTYDYDKIISNPENPSMFFFPIFIYLVFFTKTPVLAEGCFW